MSRHTAPVGFYAAEAAGLRWLAEAALFRSLRSSATRFGNAPQLCEVGEALADVMGRLGIPSCFVALAEPGGGYRGALGVRERALIQDVHGHFSSERLLPESFLAGAHRATWLLEPLIVQKRRLGYVVFELGPLEGRVYVSLRDQLGLALAGVSQPG